MKIGARVTPINPTLHLKHGFGCLVHFHNHNAVVHFENGTRGSFSVEDLTRQLTVTEAARAAAKDMLAEGVTGE